MISPFDRVRGVALAGRDAASARMAGLKSWMIKACDLKRRALPPRRCPVWRRPTPTSGWSPSRSLGSTRPALLSRAAKLEPDNAIYWEYLAELHGRLEQFPAAIRCWERVLAQTPDTGRTHTSPSAGALHELNRPVDAECHHVAAVAVEPSSAEAQFELGVFFQDQGKFDEAEAAFRAAVALQPTHDPARPTWHPSS